MKYTALLPEVTERYPEGQSKLAFLIERARAINNFIEILRSEGRTGLTYYQILLLASERSPELLKDLERELLHFNGTRVAPCAKTFFKWYETTEEGQRYKRDMIASTSSLYGEFLYRHFDSEQEPENNNCDDYEFNEKRINAIREVIRRCYRKRTSINGKFTSYSMKHDMENYLGRVRHKDHFIGGYVSNEEMIQAMILEGYKHTPSDINTRNICFNVPMVDVQAFHLVSTFGNLGAVLVSPKKQAAICERVSQIDPSVRVKCTDCELISSLREDYSL